MACPLAAERVWVEKSRYHDAEREYYERLAKLLKGTESIGQNENQQLNMGLEKPKKKAKRTATKSKSPEAMVDNVNAVPSLKATPPSNAATTRPKKQKKQKVVESETVTVNMQQDVLINNKIEEVASSGIAEGVEETKSKKKKKRKTNKDVGEKLQDLSHKENVPPSQPIIEAKVDSRDSGKKMKNGDGKGPSSNQCTLVSEIAKARQHIKNSLEKMDGIATLAASPASPEILERLAAIEKDNADLRKLIEGLKGVCLQSENRVKTLEQKLAAVNISHSGGSTVTPTTHAAPPPPKNVEDDDGVDLFGSDSENESADAAKIREERLAAYAAKKSKKPALIAKSSLVLDIKPWDDETDMKAMETNVRKIVSDGLLWGASKCVPIAYGIQKLSITCVVEDEKVSIDWLTEEIEKIDDYVQSVDVAAFNKI